MRAKLTALLILVPAIALGQSLGELAKKEKERREKNKREGKTARVISEEDLAEVTATTPMETIQSGGGASGTANRGDRDRQSFTEDTFLEEGAYDVPDRIPPDAPLEEKIQMFQMMKRDYEIKAREIDENITKNETRIRELESEIAQLGTVGGGGLPTGPQQPTGTGVNTMTTGQGQGPLVAEKQRLETMNEQLRGRKEQLKLDLQTKGRVAGIPAGFLRF